MAGGAKDAVNLIYPDKMPFGLHSLFYISQIGF
jgi:hypothetical protein